MRHILVLRGGALGDFIVTLPALAALRATFPTARIELAGNATAGALALRRGLVDAVHPQGEARWASLYAAEQIDWEFGRWLDAFDLVVSFWPDADGDLKRHFPRHPGQRFLAASAHPERGPAAAHFLTALAPLGVGGAEVRYDLAPLARRATGERVDGRVTVAMHPGSGSARKNWPRERWLELIGATASPVLLITGEVEAEPWGAAALAQSPVAARLEDGSVRLAANQPLETLIEQLSACRLFIGHDSGVSHLAAACGLRCVLLFGPTDPGVWSPPGPGVTVIQRGASLEAITVEDVLRASAS